MSLLDVAHADGEKVAQVSQNVNIFRVEVDVACDKGFQVLAEHGTIERAHLTDVLVPIVWFCLVHVADGSVVSISDALSAITEHRDVTLIKPSWTLLSDLGHRDRIVSQVAE